MGQVEMFCPFPLCLLPMTTYDIIWNSWTEYLALKQTGQVIFLCLYGVVFEPFLRHHFSAVLERNSKPSKLCCV